MDNKKNDIIEEQRRAREEFLRLKKMQKGELDAGPKPSEIAIVPKTQKEKWDNFWFQYKWVVIALVSLFTVLTVLIAQCASRKNPDLEIVYFSYTPILDQQTTLIGEYFEDIAKDVNGDGEVIVQVINCSFSNNNNIQYRNSILSKLQAIIAADEKALLFITDNKSIEYFNNLNADGGVFDGEPIPLGEEFYKGTESKDYGPLTAKLSISIRRVSDTLLVKKEDIGKYFDESKRILNEIS